VITADLDAELVAAARAIEPGLTIAAVPAPWRTWRPAADGNPASYATTWPFDLARATGRPPAELAAALAGGLAEVPWLTAAEPTGGGYVTITVTPQALAGTARHIVAAGPACARSDLLHGTAAAVMPWPDPAAARTWRQAWQDQAAAMTGRLAETAGAALTSPVAGERGTRAEPSSAREPSPVLAAADYLGVDAVRYRLARTLPGRVGQLALEGRLHCAGYAAVRLAHAEAASVLRWSGELGITQLDLGDRLAWLLQAEPERELLGLLSWLAVRVAAAARRRRPGEVPHFLEQVASGWTACRLACPALPFGGSAAPREPEQAAARLLLAAAVRVVLAAGLALTGIRAPTSISAASSPDPACPDSRYL
jgi:arginyl-tRNA synthetase